MQASAAGRMNGCLQRQGSLGDGAGLERKFTEIVGGMDCRF